MAARSGIRKRSEDAPPLDGKLIEVKVGKEEVSFHVHKDLICASSESFRTTTDDKTKEFDGILRLPLEQTGVFRIYVQWLYFRKVFSILASDEDVTHRTAHYYEWQRLLDLYMCGNSLKDKRFCNAVMDAACEKLVQSPHSYPRNLASMAFEFLDSSSRFCRLIVDMHALIGEEDWIMDERESSIGLGDDFMEYVIRRMIQLRQAGSDKDKTFPWVDDPCRYHEHPDGYPRCSNNSSPSS